MDINLEKYIRENTESLKEEYDGFIINLPNNKCVLMTVEINPDKHQDNDYEYFVELNDMDEDGAIEPCGYWNDGIPFGDIDELVKMIEEYLDYHDINVDTWNEVE